MLRSAFAVRARSWESCSLSESIRSLVSASSTSPSFPEIAAPRRVPTASAMNTAASETRSDAGDVNICGALSTHTQSGRGRRAGRRRAAARPCAPSVNPQPPEEARPRMQWRGVATRVVQPSPPRRDSAGRRARRTPWRTSSPDDDQALAPRLPQEAGRPAAHHRPARAFLEPASVRRDTAVGRPPVGEVVRLGDQRPGDHSATQAQRARGFRSSRHLKSEDRLDFPLDDEREIVGGPGTR